MPHSIGIIHGKNLLLYIQRTNPLLYVNDDIVGPRRWHLRASRQEDILVVDVHENLAVQDRGRQVQPIQQQARHREARSAITVVHEGVDKDCSSLHVVNGGFAEAHDLVAGKHGVKVPLALV